MSDDLDFTPPPKTASAGGDAKRFPLWIPKHGEGSISGYFLRPDEVAKRVSRCGHFVPGRGTLWCKSCTEENRWGEYCGATKGLIANAMRKDPSKTQREAQKGLTATERYLYPFYVYRTYKDKKSGETKSFEGFAGLELNYTAAFTQLGACAEKLGKRCRSCGANNSVTRTNFTCRECNTVVQWSEEEKKNRKYPFCPSCHDRVPAVENVECSKCPNGARTTVHDTKVTISKLADNKTVDFEFEIPITPPDDKVLSVERYDLLDLVPYTDAREIMAAFGISAGPAEAASPDTNADFVDEVPF